MKPFISLCLLIAFFSCANEDYDLDAFICGNAKEEYFQHLEAYQSYMDEYDQALESGEIQPEIVNGIDIGLTKWALEDPEERAMRFAEVKNKWIFCPYVDRPEAMDGF